MRGRRRLDLPSPALPAAVAPPDFASWSPARRDEWFTTANKEIVAAEQGERESLSSSTMGYGSREAMPSSVIRVADGAPSEAKEFQPAYTKGLVALTGAELLQRDFPPLEMVLAPFLPEKGLAMIFAERGIGKTWAALNVAHAVAGGGTFLRWKAPASRRVVYIDGEMPAAALKERYATIVDKAPFEAPEDSFRLVAADLQPRRIARPRRPGSAAVLRWRHCGCEPRCNRQPLDRLPRPSRE